ncbi:MAG: bifunctional DNA-formamidopyrimidine glycosylase/DNA-(apurinic or apyrimidinic site) lyase [Gemmataceae bacterium]|nr:bifunctional DNA-formamidopyrimidine glycosylase/DNA-(apurinic or apyrimidinic site) lyase [Gemmataceae bacterium]
MPELPEVETVVRDLRPAVVGRRVVAVRHGAKRLRRPWDPAWNDAVAGRQVGGIRRRGKWIVVELQTPPPNPLPRGGRGDRTNHPVLVPPPPAGEGVRGWGLFPNPRLVVHLGMTGQLTAAPAADPEPDHLHLTFALSGGTELRFRDVRRFGSATLYPDEAAVEAGFGDLGPEPFGLDTGYFRNALAGTARNLKAVLLDQSIVAGVGNIYADEACSLAGLHPGRRADALTRAEADRLRESVEAVLTAAIAGRGSTIRDYVGGSGLRGEFQLAHRVYGRTGEPCGTCATAIECVRLAGRSSHYCPACQPDSPRRARKAQRSPG